MSMETFTDADLAQIVDLALQFSEGEIEEITLTTIEPIADGDEDILIIIHNLIELRFLLWTDRASGLRFLESDRAIDREIYLKENPISAATDAATPPWAATDTPTT